MSTALSEDHPITLLCRLCQHAFHTFVIRDLCPRCRYAGAEDVLGEMSGT